MNVMTRFTVKSLRANRVRTAVTVAGVALAAALITAVLTTFTSLSGYLYQVEGHQSGTWMALAQKQAGQEFDDELLQAADRADVDGLAEVTDVGFAQLGDAQKNIFGPYLPIADIRTVKGDIQEVCAIRAWEGRLPQQPGEVMLSRQWKNYEGVQLGDQVTYQVGQRLCVAAPEGAGDQGEQTPGDEGLVSSALGGAGVEFGPGSMLDSSVSYLDPELDGSPFGEELQQVHERSYTVVGFYDGGNYAVSTPVGLLALTAGDPEASGLASAYVSYTGVSTMDQVEERTQELFPQAGTTLHTAMLRFMGISGDGAIWSTFYGIVGVLAAVVAAACVSLIYNAFAISVAERVNQFALLSSVGASRRQLRRSVLVEGLLVALMGIPLGLLVGIGGCGITFHFMGDSISAVVGSPEVPFGLTVQPYALAGAAALTFVTVLLSVWIPSKRAASANIVESLRSSGDMRVSKAGIRDAARATDSGRLWRRRGLTARLFGIGGTLASIQRRRGASRGRTAAVSLALAIVLLMTAGSLNVFLGQLVSAAGAEADCDLCLSTYRTDLATMDGAGTIQAVDDKAEAASSLDGMVSAYQDAYALASTTPGAEPLGYSLQGSLPVSIPTSMLGDSAASVMNVQEVVGLPQQDARATFAQLSFLPDDEFLAYAAQAGADASPYVEKGEPCAVAVADAYGNDGNQYLMMNVFGATGSVQVCDGGTVNGQPIGSFTFESRYEDGQDGAMSHRIYPLPQGDDPITPDEVNQAQVSTVEVPVVALAQDSSLPALGSGSVQLVLPLGCLGAFNPQMLDPTLTADFDVSGGMASEVAAAMEELLNDDASLRAQGLRFHVFDYQGEVRSMQMLGTVVNVFCLLFTVILALIAMANVFNTVTNGLILRKREFAVMRSAGMSGRQFRRMIASECVGFGIGGLIPGLIISVAVSYLLWHMISLSLNGPGFMLPWGYVAIAVAMTFAAMGLSVAYGMHRCKADSIVEALRSDNI